jgi:hypothetical protein
VREHELPVAGGGLGARGAQLLPQVGVRRLLPLVDLEKRLRAGGTEESESEQRARQGGRHMCARRPAPTRTWKSLPSDIARRCIATASRPSPASRAARR